MRHAIKVMRDVGVVKKSGGPFGAVIVKHGKVITAQENEKAFAREAMSQLRKEMEFAASKKFGFNWG